jgi:hypothetical protein
MAYLRKENETVEIDYPFGRVWSGVQDALAKLEWVVEEKDETAHHFRVKTKAGPMSFSSVLLIDVVPAGENKTRVSVAAETPVTTITAIVDFRQGKRRILMFFQEMAKELNH